MRMWIIPADQQPKGVVADGKLNFTWEVVKFVGNQMKI